MSLKIYVSREDVPKDVKIIDINDRFFDAKVCLLNTKFESLVLNKIDKAVYASSNTFIGRSKWMGQLNKNMLSTGAKTLLNINSHPEICFNLCECGQNVLRLLPMLHSGQVLLRDPIILYSGSSDCDIIYNNTHYTDFYVFLDNLMGGI